MKINVTNGKQPINLLIEAGTYEKKYKTAEGNPVILTDAWSNYPLKSLGVNMNPIQDLHGYDHPWVGGNGANKCIEEWESGDLSGTDGTPVASTTYIRTKVFSPCESDTTYYVVKGNASRTYIFWYDETFSHISHFIVAVDMNMTSPSNAKYFKICAETTVYNNDIAVNYPSTVTTYSPYENICPISGWSSVDVYKSGVNVWDEEWESGAYSTTGSLVSSNIYISSKNKIAVKPSTEYYFYKSFTSPLYLCEYGQDESFLRRTDIVNFSGGKAFTTSADAYYINFSVGGASTPVATYGDNISINYPSTDTEYHAYNGTTTTVNLGRTVYGCEVDIVSGQMVIDRKYQLLNGSENAWYNYEYQGVNSFRFIPNDMASVQSMEGVIITNEFTFKIVAWALGYYGTFSGSGASIYFRPPNAEITTLADFKTWLASNNLQIVYPLANPQTIQLTPEEVKTLMKETILMTNADSLLVEYRTNER